MADGNGFGSLGLLLWIVKWVFILGGAVALGGAVGILLAQALAPPEAQLLFVPVGGLAGIGLGIATAVLLNNGNAGWRIPGLFLLGGALGVLALYWEQFFAA